MSHSDRKVLVGSKKSEFNEKERKTNGSPSVVEKSGTTEQQSFDKRWYTNWKFYLKCQNIYSKREKEQPSATAPSNASSFFSYSLWNLYSPLVWHRSSENEIECEIFCCCCCCLIPLHESCPLAKRKQANTFVVGVDSVGSVMRKWKISFIETVLFRELFDLFSEFLAFTNHTLIIDVWNIRCM